MGNQKSNEQFDPNFDFDEYNRKLQKIKGQYGHNNQLNNFNFGPAPTQKKAQTINCEEIQRNAYLFKPSLQIAIKDGRLVIQFSYDSQINSELCINVGVKGIKQNEETKKTESIDCKVQFKDTLNFGNKVKYRNQFDVRNLNEKELKGEGILIRIFCMDEISQYSLAFLRNKSSWKTVLQKFQKGNDIYGIQDIYGDSQNQECIICMCESSNTMIKPCNHVCLCSECAKTTQKKTNNCPICRKRIMQLVTLQK